MRKRPRLGPRQKLSCRERSQPARCRGRRSAKKRKRHRRKETRKGAKNDKRKKRATTRRRGELETHDASPLQTRGPPGPGRGSRKRPKKESPELSCAPKRGKKERKKGRKKERKQRKHEKRKVGRELDELHTVGTASPRRRKAKKPQKNKKLSQRQRPPITPCLRLIGRVLAGAGSAAPAVAHRLLLSQTNFNDWPTEKKENNKKKQHGQVADTEASRDG